MALAGCGRTHPLSTDLRKGETAYLRVKEYSTGPMKGVTPSGDQAKIQFGEAVKLMEKKMGWLRFGWSPRSRP
jgi:hypothetical protein